MCTQSSAAAGGAKNGGGPHFKCSCESYCEHCYGTNGRALRILLIISIQWGNSNDVFQTLLQPLNKRFKVSFSHLNVEGRIKSSIHRPNMRHVLLGQPTSSCLGSFPSLNRNRFLWTRNLLARKK